MARQNSSLYFNGSNEYVYFTNVTSLGASDFSVSWWIKTTDADGDMLSWQPLSLTEDYLQLSISGGKFITSIRDHGGGGTTNTSGSIDIDTGEWVFLTYTRSTTNGLKAYVNGVLDGSGAAASNNNGDIISTDFKLMRDNYANSAYIQGNISRVCYWNMELSAAQISTIMGLNDYSHLSSQIRHYWAMDEGTGTFGNTIGSATISVTGTPDWQDGPPLSAESGISIL